MESTQRRRRPIRPSVWLVGWLVSSPLVWSGLVTGGGSRTQTQTQTRASKRATWSGPTSKTRQDRTRQDWAVSNCVEYQQQQHRHDTDSGASDGGQAGPRSDGAGGKERCGERVVQYGSAKPAPFTPDRDRAPSSAQENTGKRVKHGKPGRLRAPRAVSAAFSLALLCFALVVWCGLSASLLCCPLLSRP